MGVHNTPKRDYHVATGLKGDELIPFEIGTEGECRISARHLKTYVGGDIARPTIRPESGATSIAISEFPNAEFDLQPGDSVTGLQNGRNVNFTYDHIVRGVIAAIAKANKG